MKKHLSVIGVFVWLLCATIAQAQVTGMVTSTEDGLPLPGTIINVKGTSTATIADGEGKYQIAASSGDMLTFSLVGYTVQTLKVENDKSVLNVTLTANTQLETVEITGALGLKKNERAIGYNVQQVRGEEIASTQRDNWVDALNGRVSGLIVTSSSGGMGASSTIQLRGASSIGGSNQPLIIVDGLPMDNNTFSQGSLVSDQPNRQNDYTNRIADLNSNDIESVTVLKGPEAAALYGSQGSAGAIVIVTKKGAQGRGKLTYNTSFRTDEVYRLPKLQQQYTRGLNGVYNADEILFFGPAISDSLTVYDNMNAFFQRGSNVRHGLTFEAGTERLSYRMSANYNDAKGVVPNTGLTATNLRLSGSAKLLKNLEITSTLMFSNSDTRKPTGGDVGILTNLFRWPTYENVTNYLNPDGSRRRLQPSLSTEYDNPFFNANKLVNRDQNRRTTTNLGAIYSPTTWLTLTGRFGIDAYTTLGNFFGHPEANIGITPKGFVENFTENSRLQNASFVAQARKTWGDFGFSLMTGTTVDDRNYEVTAVRGEQLYDPNFNSLNNTLPTTMRNKLSIKRNRLIGLFGSADLSYQRWAYLTVTGRNDWSSTLPAANRSYFYPSASLSLILSELNALKNIKWLDLVKVRAATARSGKDAPAFVVQSALAAQTTTGGGYIYGFFGGNPDLKPEFTSGREVGIDVRMFRNRLKFDVSYFSNTREDQIVSQRLSYGTGFVFGLVNGGSFQVNGVEVGVTVVPIRTKMFEWEVVTNFTQNKTKVLSLPAGQNEYYNSDTWLYANARASAFTPIAALQNLFPTTNLSYNQRGAGSATAIGGYSYLRNDKGEVLINPSNGLPVINSTFLPIGDRNPDFIVGIQNRFTFNKSLTLSFNLEARKGGDVFNGNERFLFVNGLSTRLTDRSAPYVFKGVLRDGKENTETPTVNNVQVTPQTRSDFYTSGFAESDFVEKDINWLRLRDLTLSYKLSDKLIKSIRGVESMSVFVTGTDLFLLTNYTGADPAVNGTTATSAGVGAVGFDFGKIGRPRSFSVGLTVALQ